VCVKILVGKRRWCFVITVTVDTTPFALVCRAFLKVSGCACSVASVPVVVVREAEETQLSGDMSSRMESSYRPCA
jgi:hypothetical protein